MKADKIDFCSYWQMEVGTTSYRRHGAECWEELMGDSWEPVYFKESELEEAFQTLMQYNMISAIETDSAELDRGECD